MNLSELHSDKEISAANLFKGETGTTNAIQLQPRTALKKHTTKTPALLLCVSGEVVYEDEQQVKIIMRQGDYVEILPDVVHWVEAVELSQLILMK